MANLFKPSKTNTVVRPKDANKTLQITGIDHLARGISNDEKGIYFVQGALPDETVEANVQQHKGNVHHAQVTHIIQPSEARRQPFCAHYAECGGCETQHCDSEDLLRFKQQAIGQLILHTGIQANEPVVIKKAKLGARRNIKPKARTIASLQKELPWQPPLNSVDRHYRHKTRLAIDARNPHDIHLGFRTRGSSDVFNLTQCPILVPELQALIAPLHTLVNSISQPLRIGHITLVKSNNKTLVSIRLVKALSKEDQLAITDFAQQQNVAVEIQTQTGHHNVGEEDSLLTYSPIDSIELQFQPDDFVQVNAKVNQQMVAQAIDWLALDKDDKVLDLFCGIGNFSVPIAQHCAQVIGIEGVSKMVQRATKNAQNNGLPHCQFRHSDLTDPAWIRTLANEKVTKVLLDPSREGAKEAIKLLPSLNPSHILYVSCNPSTFARDAAILLEQNFRIDKIGLMDMFPQTAHTELMALFVPSNTKSS
ncbi:23S rRNA (uracil(1939)-C(5))-methyltransferase RlmD [Aliiglaciecola litoralis]|uniref:23S rRNA (Uracil(1939)-C(5))-methyltransferase RlmD n=1 Tax=Aliiglaciecola litoralis TaxID=582857 RepID=A0ABN1LG67_9ALTE